jgi:hypothetical protein
VELGQLPVSILSEHARLSLRDMRRGEDSSASYTDYKNTGILAILFAKAGANLIISARRPDKLAEVKSAAVKANAEGGSGGGGKVFEWVQDVQDRRGVDRELYTLIRDSTVGLLIPVAILDRSV